MIAWPARSFSREVLEWVHRTLTVFPQAFRGVGRITARQYYRLFSASQRCWGIGEGETGLFSTILAQERIAPALSQWCLRLSSEGTAPVVFITQPIIDIDNKGCTTENPATDCA